ncbi:MAG: nucleotidyltransferase domain-containing protein [Acidimicrobiia bacterium]
MEHHWEPMSIAEVEQRFAPAGTDWWIAGGHAIDLFLGWETRPHADLDVEMFRSDRAALFDIFEGWDLHVASDGQLLPWSDPEELDDSVFGVWLRPEPNDPWKLEIMLADGNRAQWRFRREPSITMSGDKLIRTTAEGIPYCTPEVQLLYKSKQARTKDDVDLARCLHRMTADQRTWLTEAVERTTAHHPWISVLEASLERQHE